MDSRVESTRVIGRAIEQATHPPPTWLQMSTATIYAHRFDAPNNEATGRIGGQAWRAAELAVEYCYCSDLGKGIVRGEDTADAARGASLRNGDVSGSGRSLRYVPRPHATWPGRPDCRWAAVYLLDSRPGLRARRAVSSRVMNSLGPISLAAPHAPQRDLARFAQPGEAPIGLRQLGG